MNKVSTASREAQFVKVPFYCGSFPAPLPQFDCTEVRITQVFKKKGLSSFVDFGLDTDTQLAVWCKSWTEFEQNAKSRPIPGYGGLEDHEKMKSKFTQSY